MPSENRQLSAAQDGVAATLEPELDTLTGKFTPSAETLNNPLLKKVITKLVRDIPRARVALAAMRTMHCGWEAEEYERWLGAMLPGSGLVQQIAAGPDQLADIYPRMPYVLRLIEQARRPRNYEQLLEHLYEYLECYLDPSRPVPWPREYGYAIAITLGITGLSSIFWGGVQLLAWVMVGLILLIHVVNILRWRRVFRTPKSGGIHRIVNMVLLGEYLFETLGKQPSSDAVEL